MKQDDEDIDRLVADLLDQEPDDTAMLSRAVLTRLASDTPTQHPLLATVLIQPTSLAAMFGGLFLLTIWLGYMLTPALAPDLWTLQSDLAPFFSILEGK